MKSHYRQRCEKRNPEELQFYWKGKAYDDPFDFQDRLQRLYKAGMEEFLGEDITYIDNKEIERMFRDYDLDMLEKHVKETFKKLKFFQQNDFAFLEVHNEKLFYQNFEILLEVVNMIQDIRFTSSQDNQFLGDLFEGFLDQGIKQSEGQFFTPLPIVRFIINSLPELEKPKVIDYACGAGHFLNEYANINRESKIVGIEKEYRLSKVAKVSSFMYGHDIEILYNDALVEHSSIENGTFDLLISNPPYSVKGFLETLSPEDREKFELIKTIDEKSYLSNNAIETFFIERAKQLVKVGGLASIIVPSSILNKGSSNIVSGKKNIYVA
ncbi:MAG TPA: SAM-dependent DNA methyltransferase, partial [Campylobacterales bacterium]|nr:SAM-dependent DNA methyltransferase [Campylobacterales bacterium]